MYISIGSKKPDSIFCPTPQYMLPAANYQCKYPRVALLFLVLKEGEFPRNFWDLGIHMIGSDHLNTKSPSHIFQQLTQRNQF